MSRVDCLWLTTSAAHRGTAVLSDGLCFEWSRLLHELASVFVGETFRFGGVRSREVKRRGKGKPGNEMRAVQQKVSRSHPASCCAAAF